VDGLQARDPRTEVGESRQAGCRGFLYRAPNHLRVGVKGTEKVKPLLLFRVSGQVQPRQTAGSGAILQDYKANGFKDAQSKSSDLYSSKADTQCLLVKCTNVGACMLVREQR